MSNKQSTANNSKLLNSLAAGTGNQSGPQLGIGQRVNKFINEDFNGIILASLVVLLVVLVIYLYNRTFTKLNQAKQTQITYHQNLELQKLPKCERLQPELQHRLCDYYIAASYNTPAIGKQSVDYVSTDMVRRVLLNGARYIQIPIAADGVSYDSAPVVGTAEGNVITSLNTLPLREVLVAIRDAAFKFMAPESTDSERPVLRTINYPLILHLKIHTNNDGVLDQTADDIREILGEMLLDRKPYMSRLITFEPLCSLLNRIILISTPGYEASRLNELVIPIPKQFWQQIGIDSVQPDLLNEADQVAYFRSLGQTQQKSRVAALGKLSELMKASGGGIDGKTASEMMDTVLGPKAPISERLTLFNMIGMTLVEPIQKSAVAGTGGAPIDSPNYNPADAIMTGCQLIAMNYQTNDETMLGYINIFRRSSYVLKPSGLRLPASEAVIADAVGSFDLSKNSAAGGKADATFILKYGKGTDYLRLIAQSTAGADVDRSVSTAGGDTDRSDGGIARTILINGERLRVAAVSPSTTPADLFSSAGFVIKKSPLSKSGDLVMLASAAQPNLVITINPDFDKGDTNTGDVYLAPMGTTTETAKWQTFQPEFPAIVPGTPSGSGESSNPRPEYFISFRLYPTGFRDAFYLAGIRTTLKLVGKTDDNSGLLTFGVLRLPILRQIRIASANGSGTLRIFAGGVVSLSQTAPINKGALLALEPASASGTQIGANSVSVYLRDTATNKYLSSTGTQLTATLPKPDTRKSVFILAQSGDQSTLIDFAGRYLFADQTGTLLFKTDQPVIQREVKNNQGRVVKPARYGASLGSGKYFQIENEFKPI
jgi:hypothetical protein